MGLDLTLCPSQYPMAPGADWFLAYSRLKLDRQYALFDQIRALEAQPLPPAWTFDWYGDAGIQHRTEDPYGCPLTALQAGQFHRMAPAGLSPWNRAVLTFLCAVPPDTPVVLWWH